MKHTLLERTEAWVKLMLTRPDVETDRPFEMKAETEHVGAGPEYPPDAAEVAQSAKRLRVHFLGPDVDGEERASGGFCLSFERLVEPAHLELDGAEVPRESMVLFEIDEDGTGQAAWYVLRQDRPPCIVWDVETKVQFASLAEYVTEGARRAFTSTPWTWQTHGASPLGDVSMQPATLDELTAALAARGASPSMAADLVTWLGVDARLLVPASAGERANRKKAAALVEQAREGGQKSIERWKKALALGVCEADRFEAWDALLMELQAAESWDLLLGECAQALAGPDARSEPPMTRSDRTRPFLDRHAWPGNSVHSVAHLRRSVALQHLDQLEAALASVDKAVAFGATAGHWQRACVLVKMKRLDDALNAALAEREDDEDSLEGMLEDGDLAPIHQALEQKAAEEA